MIWGYPHDHGNPHNYYSLLNYYTDMRRKKKTPKAAWTSILDMYTNTHSSRKFGSYCSYGYCTALSDPEPGAQCVSCVHASAANQSRSNLRRTMLQRSSERLGNFTISISYLLRSSYIQWMCQTFMRPLRPSGLAFHGFKIPRYQVNSRIKISWGRICPHVF